LVQRAEDQHERSIREASAALRAARVAEQGAELRYTTARQHTAQRRLELGRALIAARVLWPRRGPGSGGWTAMLQRVGLDQDVALDAMHYAGYVESTGQADERPGHSALLPTMREAGLRAVHHRPVQVSAQIASDSIRLLCLWWLYLVQQERG
jgi:hypothetical protein